jgi:hypothetical protein
LRNDRPGNMHKDFFTLCTFFKHLCQSSSRHSINTHQFGTFQSYGIIPSNLIKQTLLDHILMIWHTLLGVFYPCIYVYRSVLSVQ